MSIPVWSSHLSEAGVRYYTDITEPDTCPDPTVVVPGSLCWYDAGSPTVPDWKLGTLAAWSSSQDADPYAVVVRSDGTVGSYYQNYVSFAKEQPNRKDD